MVLHSVHKQNRHNGDKMVREHPMSGVFET